MNNILIPIIAVVLLIVIVTVIILVVKKKNSNNTGVEMLVPVDILEKPLLKDEVPQKKEEVAAPVVQQKVEVPVQQQVVQAPVQQNVTQPAPVAPVAQQVVQPVQQVVSQPVPQVEEVVEEEPKVTQVTEVVVSDKPKEDFILVPNIPEMSENEFDIPELKYADSLGENVSVTEAKAVEEVLEPVYDDIPEYIDPHSIVEEGENVKVLEGVAIASEVQEEKVYEEKADELKINMPGIGESYELDQNSPFNMKPNGNSEINENIVVPKREDNFNKTEIFDLDKIKAERKKFIEEISIEELSKYINSINDDVIKEANLYIEEMKSKSL